MSLKGLTQTLTLNVPTTATIQPKPRRDRLLAAYEGESVTVWTQPALATTKAMLGTDGALSAALVQLGASVPTDEVRRALLDEGRQALVRVLGREQRAELVRLGRARRRGRCRA